MVRSFRPQPAHRRPRAQAAAWLARAAGGLGALACALLLTGAAAGDLRLRYRIEVAGVEAGRVEVEADASGPELAAGVAWRIDGLLGLLGQSRGSMEGSSRRGEGGIVPVRFEGRAKKSGRERAAVLAYDADGAIAGLDLSRNGKPRRSEVPEDLRAGTIDTLTAIWRLRAWLAAGPEADREGEPLKVFDGRLRYDLVPRYLERQGGTQRFTLRLVPRSGFDGNEVFGAEVDPDQPWAEVSVDAGLAPVEIKGQGRLPWRIVLEE